MLSLKITLISVLSLLIVFTAVIKAQSSSDVSESEPSKLGVLWTSGDRDVALKMVFMYTNASKKNGWWDEVQLIVWGPSSKLLSYDKELQDYVKNMQKVGVVIKACKACSDSYGVSDKLTELGIEVKYMGKPLSDMLKNEWTVVTF
ncbi:DsrE family protein [candidate division KSB1 bacterium]